MAINTGEQVRERGREYSLLTGDAFTKLCSHLIEEKVSEKVKIALAGKYFAQGKEKEYNDLRKIILPVTQEEITLANNQEIIVYLLKYSREHNIEYLEHAKLLSQRTVLYSQTKAFLLLALEKPAEETLREGYKLSRVCNDSALLKAIVFLNAQKYKDALSIINRLPKTPETLLLKIRAYIAVEKESASDVYVEMCKMIDEQEKEVPAENLQAVKKRLNDIKMHAERIMGNGPGIGIDKMIFEIKESLKKNTAPILVSADDFVEDNAKDSKAAKRLLQLSKAFLWEIETIRAETLYRKRRYAEAQALSLWLRKNVSIEKQLLCERIALVLIQTSLHLKNISDIDTSWVITALSKRESEVKDTGLSDFVELLKAPQPIPVSFDAAAINRIKRLLLLEDSKYIWRISINRGRCLNRLGNIYFALKRIDKAEEAYRTALQHALIEDVPMIEENITLLEQWKERKEPDLKMFPECVSLIAEENKTKCRSISEYVNAVTAIETPDAVVEELEKIVEVLMKINSGEGTAESERIANILAVCSFIDRKKEIFTLSEILSGTISMIYNHILFWAKEQQTMEISVVCRAISLFLSEYLLPSERLLAKKAILVALDHFARQGNKKRVNEVLAQVEGHLTEKEDIEKINQIKEMLKEMDLLTTADTEEVPINAVSALGTLTTEKKDADTNLDADPVLVQKRNELVRMLTEMHEKKPKKRAKKAPEVKKKKIKSKPENVEISEILNPSEPDKDNKDNKNNKDKVIETEKKAVPIKRKSKAIFSSDEDEDEDK